MTVNDLATVPGVQAYLQDHPKFAAQTVERLSGGLCNFTYRIYLRRVLAGCQTLILKYAPPYIATSGGEIPMDQKRQLIEARALDLMAQLSTTGPGGIVIPTIHLFDEEKHVIIMDDAGANCRTLKELFIKEDLPKTLAEQIGTALGEFICGVHTWNQGANIDLTLFANNQSAKDFLIFVYGQPESTLSGRDDLPSLSDPLLGLSEAKMITISKVAEKSQQAIHAASASDPLTHGDFWSPNVLVSLRRGIDGSIVGVERLCVLDWEDCKTGFPGFDLGQLCADLWTLSEFYPARREPAQSMIKSFLGAYRERRGKGADVELARVVAIQIGAYAVTLTPRTSPLSERQKAREVVEQGAEMLVLGEEGSELALKASIVGPLL